MKLKDVLKNQKARSNIKNRVVAGPLADLSKRGVAAILITVTANEGGNVLKIDLCGPSVLTTRTEKLRIVVTGWIT